MTYTVSIQGRYRGRLVTFDWTDGRIVGFSDGAAMSALEAELEVATVAGDMVDIPGIARGPATLTEPFDLVLGTMRRVLDDVSYHGTPPPLEDVPAGATP